MYFDGRPVARIHPVKQVTGGLAQCQTHKNHPALNAQIKVGSLLKFVFQDKLVVTADAQPAKKSCSLQNLFHPDY